MNLTEIENLSAAQIKEQRAALIAEASKAPADQLAARYVQARLDAKTRDEKLAEQGVTITQLQELVTSYKDAANAMKARAEAAEAEVVAGRDAKAVSEEEFRQLRADLAALMKLMEPRLESLEQRTEP